MQRLHHGKRTIDDSRHEYEAEYPLKRQRQGAFTPQSLFPQQQQQIVEDNEQMTSVDDDHLWNNTTAPDSIELPPGHDDDDDATDISGGGTTPEEPSQQRRRSESDSLDDSQGNTYRVVLPTGFDFQNSIPKSILADVHTRKNNNIHKEGVEEEDAPFNPYAMVVYSPPPLPSVVAAPLPFLTPPLAASVGWFLGGSEMEQHTCTPFVPDSVDDDEIVDMEE